MNRILFVSNGHGEAAIADRIALELRPLLASAQLDHLALVGAAASESMNDVGPHAAMPSGGLIAMGHVPNIVRDLRAGLLKLTLAQHRFLREARGRYDAIVAVGDVFALGMAFAARTKTVYVGTAKSVHVAAYGPLEERLMRRAALCFVRDDETAQRLRAHGIAVEPAANVIVDLFAVPDDALGDRAVAGFSPALALFPGSRERAYDDARFLLQIVRSLARESLALGAVLSVARSLDAERFVALARDDGWTVRREENARIPFVLLDGDREVVRAWRDGLGPVLTRVSLVLGQAGTANEAAAAAGVPVVAFERDGGRSAPWYRMRQRKLLGDALAVVGGDAAQAAHAVRALLNDGPRLVAMSNAGPLRMGTSGGARRVADAILGLLR